MSDNIDMEVRICLIFIVYSDFNKWKPIMLLFYSFVYMKFDPIFTFKQRIYITKSLR